MSDSKVSVLIPLHNSERFIEATLASVLNQSWKNIEIIIVDDGSTDKSFDAAKSCESDVVRVYRQENKGACAARNLAFQKATGEYIQFLDADDLLAVDKIDKQLQLFKTFGNDVIVSGVWGRFYKDPKTVNWEQQYINQDYKNPIDWLLDSWNEKGMIAHHAWLTPRYLIEKAGPWNEKLSINQDGEFFSRVLMQAESIKYCEEAKVYYRSGNLGSISQSSKNDKKAASLLFSYQLYKQNVSPHLSKIEVRKALGNNFLNFIYQYHNIFPGLTKEAELEFEKLDVGKMWPVGGRRFRQLAKVIGFKSAIKLHRFLV